MFTVYGPTPGTQVTFDLPIQAKEAPAAKGRKESAGKESGGTLRVTAKIPSERQKRVLTYRLSKMRVEEAGGQVRVVQSPELVDEFNEAALTEFLVRVEGLELRDPRTNDVVLVIGTPAEVIEHAPLHVRTAIVDVIMQRVRLNESLTGKSEGRSSSSTAETPPADGTAGSAESSASAASGPATARSKGPISST